MANKAPHANSTDPTSLLAELDLPTPNRGDAQRRGRKFEQLIRMVLDREDLEPTPNLRPSGEEIDGAFSYRDRTYLFEAKWQKDPIPASDLYAFKGKVDGKLTGTLGVFLSMSDYSKDAVDALVAGKELNIILFSSHDFRLVVNGKISFAEAMKRKLRYAAEYGGPFLPLEEDAIVERAPVGGAGAPLTATRPKRFHFVVEGKSDLSAFEAMFDRLVLRGVLDIHFWVAAGKLNVPALALKLIEDEPDQRVIAVIDQDRMNSAINERIRASLSDTPVSLFLIEPNLEAWLIGGFPEPQAGVVSPIGRMGRGEFATNLAKEVDIEELRRQNSAFNSLIQELTGELAADFPNPG